MKALFLGIMLLISSISAHAVTWSELVQGTQGGQIVKPLAPCQISEEDPTTYFCIGFALAGKSYVGVLREPHPHAEIVTIFTRPTPTYPDGEVNPQDLIDNVGSAI